MGFRGLDMACAWGKGLGVGTWLLLGLYAVNGRKET
jgi:hypothetical protein